MYCEPLHSTIHQCSGLSGTRGWKSSSLTGSKAGIQPKHATRLEEQLAVLNVAKRPEQMIVPGWKLHPLKGGLSGHWSVKVSENWRMTFCFSGEDAILVDYRDYH